MSASLRRRVLCVSLAAALSAGCVTQRMARGIPHEDLSAIRPGATLAEVEARLGPPVRRWSTPTGVEYRVYKYDAGVPPEPAAHLLTLISVLTFGLLEAALATDDQAPSKDDPNRFGNIAVSYSDTGVVLGVFVGAGDFDRLPATGSAAGK